MKIKLGITLFLLPLFIFGNMAQPWVMGSKHSTLYGAKNCQVLNETISIKLNFATRDYFANYKIKYTLYSNVDQTIPLLFVGIGLKNTKQVLINGSKSTINPYYTGISSTINFSEKDSLFVEEENLIYFDATLHKGENTIYVDYDAFLAYDTRGFVKEYELNYSLYPSKFWESFGKISIELALENNLEVKSSNIGTPKIKNNTAFWEIKKINTDTIELVLIKKPSIISAVLFFFQPIGLALLSLLGMFYLHFKLLDKKHKFNNRKLRFALVLGILLVPILFYVVFFLSYYLIDFSLGQVNSNHGYIFLVVFTLPVLMVIYGIIMWLINRKLKLKYIQSES